jgi:hemerythrin superfamily protein
MHASSASHPWPIRKRFLADHERIEHIALDLRETLVGGDRTSLAMLWRQFSAHLSAHLSEEEARLFPTVDAPDFRALRAEHGQIRRRLQELDADVELHALRVDNLSDFIDELHAHSEHEHARLYLHPDDPD